MRFLSFAFAFVKISSRYSGASLILIGLALLKPSYATAADLVWIGGTGAWDAAPNWSPPQLPGPVDRVYITNNGTYTVTVDRSDPVIGGLTLGGAAGAQTLALDRTIFTLVSESTVDTNGHLVLLNNGATLVGPPTLTVHGSLTWSGGDMTAAGRTVIGADGTLLIDGNCELNERTLINAGIATWSAGNFDMANGAIFSNVFEATLTTTFDGHNNVSGALPLFVNEGTFRKTGGTLNTSIDAHFINSGTVEVQSGFLRYNANQQTAGLTLLKGGGLDAQAAPIQLLGGSLVGTGLVTVANTEHLINSASLSPGLPFGQLDIAGNYQQTSSGELNIEIGGNSSGSFDLISVSSGGAGGVATLAGTLNVSLTNDFYPAPGAAFTFLSALMRVGVFDAINYPSNEVGFEISYGQNSVTLRAVNVRPTIAPIADQIADELSTLAVAASATDADPGQSLTWSLDSAPQGMSINPITGETLWTPGEDQGSSTNSVRVRVSDNGSPGLSATAEFEVIVHEVNEPPLLRLPADQTIGELAAFQSEAAAEDTDIPTNALSFELISGPEGLTVSNDGLIAWTPTETQGPGVYVVTLRVVDLNLEASQDAQLADTNSFTVTVHELNQPPELALPLIQTATEETPFTASVSASDPDTPPNPLSYGLVAPPDGMMIDSASGEISWTPGEAQGPSTNIIEVVVTDFNAAAIEEQHLSVTNGFTVIVNEANTPPSLTMPADQVCDEETTFNLALFASDLDIPTNALTFSLIDPPTGMTMDASSGVISWIPDETQGPSTNAITVRVSDGELNATESFQIIVQEVNLPPVLTPPRDVTIHATASLSLVATAEDPDLPSQELIFELVAGPDLLEVSSDGLISWMPFESQIGVADVFIRVKDGAPGLADTRNFRITVVPRPILEIPRLESPELVLTWSAVPETSYRIESKLDLDPDVWEEVPGDVVSTGTIASKIVEESASGSKRYYRVRVLP